MRRLLIFPVVLFFCSFQNDSIGQEAAPGTIGSSFRQDVLTNRLAGDLEELRNKPTPEKFNEVCAALKKILDDAIVDGKEKEKDVPEEAKKFHTDTATLIVRKLTELLDNVDETTADLWVDAHDKLVTDLQEKKEGGFNEDKIADWIVLYQLGSRTLGKALGQDEDDDETTIRVATAFEEVDFSDQVYDVLTDFHVPRTDHNFPRTVKDLVAALKNVLAEADKTPPANGRALGDAGAKAMAEVIKSPTRGDLPTENWKEALDYFYAQLQASEEFDQDEVLHWRHAFTVLVQGLEQAEEDDKDFIGDLTTNRNRAGAPTAPGTSIGGSYGTSLGAVWHARKMARMVRVHERRMYRIQAIRGY